MSCSSDDLVISAPMYSDHEKNILKGWELGAIRIYYNDNQVFTRVGCKVHRLNMMKWSNLTKCGLLFINIFSPAVHTILLSMLQRLDSRGTEALILILE